MGEVFGYARVSTSDQNAQLQIDELREAGCGRILVETAPGAGERPELAHLMDLLRPGDTVVVWRLDRLGRSLKDLIERVDDLHRRGVALRSLRETIDTSSAGGRLVLHVFASLAEFERDLIRERTNAGLAAARARGRFGGRPRVLSEDQERIARDTYQQGRMTVTEISVALGVGRSTVYRVLRRPWRPEELNPVLWTRVVC
nr:recombinase family protein [Microbacterium oxydans]